MTPVTLADALAAAGLALKRHTTGNHRAPCPRCNRGARDDALGVTIAADWSAVWHCFRCGWAGAWQPKDLMPRGPVKVTARPRPARVEKRRWSLYANGLWSRAEPIEGSPVETYLRSRGCAVPADADLRFHPNIHGHPTMVARISDAITNEPMSLHFTFLKRDGSGKAEIEKPKLLLADHQKAGGVVRLCADAEVTIGLGLSEGIETALSATAAGWSPVWAAIDAGNLSSFPILAGIESLTVFADNDESGTGQRAADQVATRWREAGREARIVLPPELGTDWNDARAA